MLNEDLSWLTFVAASNADFSLSPWPRITFDSKRTPKKIKGIDISDTSVIFQLKVNDNMMPTASVDIACSMAAILDPVACKSKFQ